MINIRLSLLLKQITKNSLLCIISCRRTYTSCQYWYSGEQGREEKDRGMKEKGQYQ